MLADSFPGVSGNIGDKNVISILNRHVRKVLWLGLGGPGSQYTASRGHRKSFIGISS